MTPQRLIPPGEVGREQDGGTLGVDVAGGTDTDGLDLVALPSSATSAMITSGSPGCRAPASRAVPLDDRPVGLDHPGRDLRAADIDTDSRVTWSLLRQVDLLERAARRAVLSGSSSRPLTASASEMAAWERFSRTSGVVDLAILTSRHSGHHRHSPERSSLVAWSLCWRLVASGSAVQACTAANSLAASSASVPASSGSPPQLLDERRRVGRLHLGGSRHAGERERDHQGALLETGTDHLRMLQCRRQGEHPPIATERHDEFVAVPSKVDVPTFRERKRHPQLDPAPDPPHVDGWSRSVAGTGRGA